jgi:hypothetical protein
MKLGFAKFILGIMLIIVFVMVTCKSNSLLSYRQVKESFVDGKVKTFVHKIRHREGVYLMENDKKTLYLMLNKLSKDKNKVPYITDVVVKPVGEALTISYSEIYKNSMKGKKPNNNLLYRIKLNKNFKLIKVFKNGEETHFENVYL